MSGPTLLPGWAAHARYGEKRHGRAPTGNDPTMASVSDVLVQRYQLRPGGGRGGVGEVRAGTALRLGRDVAIKLLRADIADEVELRTRFDREARAAARIAHPNV